MKKINILVANNLRYMSTQRSVFDRRQTRQITSHQHVFGIDLQVNFEIIHLLILENELR